MYHCSLEEEGNHALVYFTSKLERRTFIIILTTFLLNRRLLSTFYKNHNSFFHSCGRFIEYIYLDRTCCPF